MDYHKKASLTAKIANNIRNYGYKLPHLINLWLQSTSASVLEKFVRLD